MSPFLSTYQVVKKIQNVLMVDEKSMDRKALQWIQKGLDEL